MAKELKQRLEKRIMDELRKRNRDYAENLRANPKLEPHIELIEYGKSNAFKLEGRKYA